MVDAPDTLGKMMRPENFEKLRKNCGMENDGLVLPDKVADTYYHLSQQHRSAWTYELDLGSYSDNSW